MLYQLIFQWQFAAHPRSELLASISIGLSILICAIIYMIFVWIKREIRDSSQLTRKELQAISQKILQDLQQIQRISQLSENPRSPNTTIAEQLNLLVAASQTHASHSSYELENISKQYQQIEKLLRELSAKIQDNSTLARVNEMISALNNRIQHIDNREDESKAIMDFHQSPCSEFKSDLADISNNIEDLHDFKLRQRGIIDWLQQCNKLIAPDLNIELFQQKELDELDQLISNAPNITWFELLSDALEDHFQKLFKQTQSKPLVTSEQWSDILIRMLDEMDKINEETNAAEQKAFAHFRKLIEDKLWDMGIDQDPIIIGETSFNAHIHELVGHQTTAIKEQNGKIAAVTRCGLLQKLHGKQSLLRKALVLVFTSDEI